MYKLYIVVIRFDKYWNEFVICSCQDEDTKRETLAQNAIDGMHGLMYDQIRSYGIDKFGFTTCIVSGIDALRKYDTREEAEKDMKKAQLYLKNRRDKNVKYEIAGLEEYTEELEVDLLIKDNKSFKEQIEINNYRIKNLRSILRNEYIKF